MEICTPHSVSERVCVPAKVCRLGSRFSADIGIPGRAQRLAVGCLQASFCKVLRGKKKRLLLACSQHACVFLLIPGTWDPSLTLAMTAAKCRRILVRFPASRRRQFQKWGCARVHFKHSNAYGVAWCARLWSPKLLCLWRMGFPM